MTMSKEEVTLMPFRTSKTAGSHIYTQGNAKDSIKHSRFFAEKEVKEKVLDGWKLKGVGKLTKFLHRGK